jgi:hypothetical protein
VSRPSRRLVLSLVVAALVLAGCGDDDDQGAGTATSPAAQTAPERSRAGEGPDASDAQQAFVDRDELFGLLRQDGLRLTRVPGTVVTLRNVDPAPVTVERLAEKSGSQFDVLTFRTPADAHRAEPSVKASRAVDGTAVGVNLVAAFPAGASEAVRARVTEVLDRLTEACRGADGDDALRDLCFRGAAATTSTTESAG